MESELNRELVDVVVHLRGDEPLMASVGGRNVLLVPPSVGPHSLSKVVGGLPRTSGGASVMSEEDPITVWGSGAGTAVVDDGGDMRDEEDGVNAEEDPDTPYGHGTRPARRADPGVMTVDLDGLLDPLLSAGLRADSERVREIGKVAHIVVAPDELPE